MSSYGGAVSEELRPWIRVMYFHEKHGKLFTGWLCVLLTTVWFLSWLLLYPVSLHVLQIVQDVRDRRKKARREEHQDIEFDPQAAINTTKKKGFVHGKNMTMTGSMSANTIFSTARRDNSRSPSRVPSLSNAGSPQLHSHYDDRTLPPHLIAPHRTSHSLTLYRIKLARELIFLSLAVPSGICLALYAALSRDPMQDLLTKFSSFHQIVFTMAAGHFCCTILEDYKTSFWLDAGMEIEGSQLFPLTLICPWRHDRQLHLAYFINQFVEIFALVFILQTGKLAGLGVQCLLFEVPNLIDLRRRIDIAKDSLPPWLSNQQSLRIHWRLVLAFFVLARGGAIALWIYTLVRGDDVLTKEFREVELIIYYVLVGYFTIFNLRAFLFLVRIAKADEARVSNFQEQGDGSERPGWRATWAGLAISRNAEADGQQKAQNQVQFADLRESQQDIDRRYLDSRYSLDATRARTSQDGFVMDLT